MWEHKWTGAETLLETIVLLGGLIIGNILYALRDFFIICACLKYLGFF